MLQECSEGPGGESDTADTVGLVPDMDLHTQVRGVLGLWGNVVLQLSPEDTMLGIDNVGLDFAELDLIMRSVLLLPPLLPCLLAVVRGSACRTPHRTPVVTAASPRRSMTGSVHKFD